MIFVGLYRLFPDLRDALAVVRPETIIHPARGHRRHRFLFLRQLGHHRFGGDQKTRNRGRVLQRGPHHLGGVDDALGHEVDVVAVLGVEATHPRRPDARLYAPPGLTRKRPDLRFDAELADEPEPAIDQVIFRGSFAMEEVAFFHRVSRTAIIGDLVQRFPESKMSGWRGMLMRLDGLVGEHGSTPREWRASFVRRGAARRARDRVLGWEAERLLIAPG
jgi:hypothetical protein